MKLSYHLTVCVLVSCYCQSSLLVQQAWAEHDDGSPDESIRHQGSWSHWWSYDGISGPDYWNINKQWRSCSSGRKQSPINIRTERLVYDHLLGPIHLAWQREPSTAAAASDSPPLPEVAEVLEQSASNTNNQPDTTTTTTTTSSSSSASATSGHQHHVRVRLLNSGRGIEAWLEPGEGGAAQAAPPAHSDPQQAMEEAEPAEEEARRHHRHQLVVSRGPLSYSYKLFKIELHSSGNYAINKQLNELNQEDNSNDDEHNDGGDGDGDNHQSNVENNTPGQQSRGVPEASKWSSSGAASPANAASKSSEHLIDGKSLDAEVQLHFYNKQLALSSHEALNLINSAGAPASLFTIISVFVSLRRPTTTTTTASNATTDGPLDFIFNNLQALQNQGNAIELRLPRHHIDSLITTQSDYITYQGSLNRPPCAESVDWILLNKALRVDLEKFALLYEKLNTNQENIRPIKPLNGRQLRTSINLGPRNNHFYHQYEEKNCAKQSNCTNRAALNSIQTANSNQGGPIDDKEEIKSRWRQCSMKPNYVYQFSYGKSSANTNR